LTATLAGQLLKARLSPDVAQMAVGQTVWLQVMSEHTCFYIDEEIVP
jgi:glycerol transport system ATP-binding protein